MAFTASPMNIKHQHLCMFNQMTTVITAILSLGHLWSFPKSTFISSVIMQFYGVINRWQWFGRKTCNYDLYFLFPRDEMVTNYKRISTFFISRHKNFSFAYRAFFSSSSKEIKQMWKWVEETNVWGFIWIEKEKRIERGVIRNVMWRWLKW